MATSKPKLRLIYIANSLPTLKSRLPHIIYSVSPAQLDLITNFIDKISKPKKFNFPNSNETK